MSGKRCWPHVLSTTWLFINCALCLLVVSEDPLFNRGFDISPFFSWQCFQYCFNILYWQYSFKTFGCEFLPVSQFGIAYSKKYMLFSSQYLLENRWNKIHRPLYNIVQCFYLPFLIHGDVIKVKGSFWKWDYKGICSGISTHRGLNLQWFWNNTVVPPGTHMVLQ